MDRMLRLIIVVLAAGVAAGCERGTAGEPRGDESPSVVAGGDHEPGVAQPPSPGADPAPAEEGPRLVYVDVRQPDEWAAGRVENAIHIPHTELEARVSELAPYRDAEIVLYCRTGRRSGIAEEILRRAGFDRVHNGGGLSDLMARGVPVVR
jgi:phage shock protein E